MNATLSAKPVGWSLIVLLPPTSAVTRTVAPASHSPPPEEPLARLDLGCSTALRAYLRVGCCSDLA